MPNNTRPGLENQEHDKRVDQARRRLKKAYKRAGTWRALAAQLGLNPAYVYNFTVHGETPSSTAVRTRLGILGDKKELSPELERAVDFLAERDPGIRPAWPRTYKRGGKPAGKESKCI